MGNRFLKFSSTTPTFPDLRVKAGDKLTISKPICSQQINENIQVPFVYAEGTDVLGNKVTRKIILSLIRAADGTWVDDCWMFGIFDRPLYVAKVIHYPGRTSYTFDRL